MYIVGAFVSMAQGNQTMKCSSRAAALAEHASPRGCKRNAKNWVHWTRLKIDRGTNWDGGENWGGKLHVKKEATTLMAFTRVCPSYRGKQQNRNNRGPRRMVCAAILLSYLSSRAHRGPKDEASPAGAQCGTQREVWQSCVFAPESSAQRMTSSIMSNIKVMVGKGEDQRRVWHQWSVLL